MNRREALEHGKTACWIGLTMLAGVVMLVIEWTHVLTDKAGSRWRSELDAIADHLDQFFDGIGAEPTVCTCFIPAPGLMDECQKCHRLITEASVDGIIYRRDAQ